jgi:hypothetical protein
MFKDREESDLAVKGLLTNQMRLFDISHHALTNQTRTKPVRGSDSGSGTTNLNHSPIICA